ncbi:hypothetical protein HanIR_Chr08g0367861 [Helianthus annuus]|nr:hypothetical protein HanIR_Chr08g0367861 [Helianthus annuus]
MHAPDPRPQLQALPAANTDAPPRPPPRAAAPTSSAAPSSSSLLSLDSFSILSLVPHSSFSTPPPPPLSSPPQTGGFAPPEPQCLAPFSIYERKILVYWLIWFVVRSLLDLRFIYTRKFRVSRFNLGVWINLFWSNL